VRLSGTKTTRPKVSIRSWWDTYTLGRVALVACLLRVQGVRNAGLCHAARVLTTKTLRTLLHGATDDELLRAVRMVPVAFPAAREASTHANRVVERRLRPRETPSTTQSDTDSPL